MSLRQEIQRLKSTQMRCCNAVEGRKMFTLADGVSTSYDEEKVMGYANGF